MARFPYVDGPARRAAHTACLAVFDRWRQEHPGSSRCGSRCPTGSSGVGRRAVRRRARPLLLVMGGIVSVKEQWAPMLLQAERLGMAMAVAELPGIGENTLPYTEDSWRMLPALLDALADRADTGHTYAVANSFSGHLALRCAVEDERLRGIVTTGAPVSDFFTDAQWQRGLPGSPWTPSPT
ncbi:alpha/beta hydrolase [Streptomyces sp. M19]